ncbi:M23 family metallopeptidase [Nocardiopsis sp. RSe5-2]|uniref:M23 family metallopeptidase n=1 Tax=Nocardiopsis endophytica TaxID=3018445 RepID=A0ABT4U7R3_9ACTN|nr:M23 family metallopeptidase [Nocardiopsis endophytica]MDA2812995.1 M23 family metallopeptidase [Nocardiopsis endophytica]
MNGSDTPPATGFSRRAALGLTAAAAAAPVLLSPAPASASEGVSAKAERCRPRFFVPFPCGEEWHAYTHDWHWEPDRQVDWRRADGSPSEGAAVAAAAAGYVIEAAVQPPDSQYAGVSLLRIYHGRGWESRYYHMPVESMPRRGTRVHAGEQVGTVGGVGLTPDDPTGPHLHFEQWAFGRMAPLHLLGGEFVPPRRPEMALVESDNCHL